jgi:hypothetical protein
VPLRWHWPAGHRQAGLLVVYLLPVYPLPVSTFSFKWRPAFGGSGQDRKPLPQFLGTARGGKGIHLPL